MDEMSPHYNISLYILYKIIICFKNSCQVISYSIFMKFSALKTEINIVYSFDLYLYFSYYDVLLSLCKQTSDLFRW